jgi:hypothetical protein
MKPLSLVAKTTTVILVLVSLSAADERLKHQDIPQPVRNALEKLSPGYIFNSATKMTEGNGDRYEVNVRAQDEKRLRFVLSTNGELYETRDLSPKLADAPEPVRKTIERATGGRPDGMVKITRPGAKPFYRFRVTRSITADGAVSDEKFLGKAQLLQKEEVPQAVRDSLEKLLPGSEWIVVKLSGNEAPYGESYEFRAKQSGKSYWYILSPEGKVNEHWDLNLHLVDVPGPVAKVVEQATSGGEREPDNLIKVMPAGKDPYFMFRITRDIAEDGTVMAKSKD